MGHKLKDQDARVEYATQRMDIALKRTISCEEGVDWERAWQWAAAWGMAVRTYTATDCFRARKCPYRTDDCP